MKNLTARSSHQRSSVRKVILRKSLFFNKVAGLANNFIKTKALAQVFSCEFCEIKNTFFTEHFRATTPTYKGFMTMLSGFFLPLCPNTQEAF